MSIDFPALFFITVFVFFSVLSYALGMRAYTHGLLKEYDVYGMIYLEGRFFVESQEATYRPFQKLIKPQDRTEDPEYPTAHELRIICDDYIGTCLRLKDVADQHEVYVARQHLEEQLASYHQMRIDALAFQRLQSRSPYKIAGL